MESEVTSLMLSRIKEIEDRDEQQILQELAGETLQEYVYETTDRKGRKIYKLTWAGTREASRARGNIELSEPIIEDHDGFIRIVVKGTDLSNNFSVFGGCHQPKKQKVKIFDERGKEMGSQEQDDPYYFPKALSKAQRNVYQALIPATYYAKALNQLLISQGLSPLKQIPKLKAEPKPKLQAGALEVSEESIKTLHDLESVVYNRYHIQPAQLYRELGYPSRADVNESPWQCFLKIKALMEAPKA